MNQERFTSEVLTTFPGATISIDDGESLRFRWKGLVFESRQLAGGTWSIGVRDLRTTSYELAEELGEDGIEKRESVVPAFQKIATKLLP